MGYRDGDYERQRRSGEERELQSRLLKKQNGLLTLLVALVFSLVLMLGISLCLLLPSVNTILKEAEAAAVNVRELSEELKTEAEELLASAQELVETAGQSLDELELEKLQEAVERLNEATAGLSSLYSLGQ